MDDLPADIIRNPISSDSKSDKSQPGKCQNQSDDECGEVIM
jgi:hypothetical protein